MLFRLIIEITKSINSKASIGIIPFVIGIPVSAIGTDAKSAIIIEITNSKGCNSP